MTGRELDDLEAAVLDLKAMGLPHRADAVQTLIDASREGLAELKEAVIIGEGWRDQALADRREAETLRGMFALSSESVTRLRLALKRVVEAPDLESARLAAKAEAELRGLDFHYPECARGQWTPES